MNLRKRLKKDWALLAAIGLAMLTALYNSAIHAEILPFSLLKSQSTRADNAPDSFCAQTVQCHQGICEPIISGWQPVADTPPTIQDGTYAFTFANCNISGNMRSAYCTYANNKNQAQTITLAGHAWYMDNNAPGNAWSYNTNQPTPMCNSSFVQACPFVKTVS